MDWLTKNISKLLIDQPFSSLKVWLSEPTLNDYAIAIANVEYWNFHVNTFLILNFNEKYIGILVKLKIKFMRNKESSVEKQIKL